MKRAGRWCALAVLALAAGLAVRQSLRDGRTETGVAGSAPDAPPSVRRDALATAPSGPRLESAAVAVLEREWRDLIDWLDSQPAPTPEEIRDRLAEIRRRWLEADFLVLSRAVGAALASGTDRNTGLPFEVGRNGMLAGWPTLRVFLLDVLARSDPEAAAGIARGVLETTTSGDEYAVALRSLTRDGAGRASDGELLARFHRMLARDEWAASAGFAEAFDLARFLGSAEAAAALANWQGNLALRSMAIHELAAERPHLAVAAAAAPDNALDAETRASLFARADPADPGQAALVDAFLRDPSTPPEDIERFLKAFPLRSATTGFRLYGRTPAPFRREDIRRGDLAAREMVGRWMSEPALAPYGESLAALQERLDEWLADDD